MNDRTATIEFLTRCYEKDLTEIFGPDFFVHSGFAQVVQKVYTGSDPQNVLDELRQASQPVQA